MYYLEKWSGEKLGHWLEDGHLGRKWLKIVGNRTDIFHTLCFMGRTSQPYLDLDSFTNPNVCTHMYQRVCFYCVSFEDKKYFAIQLQI